MDERRREEESSLRGYEHEFERAAGELKAEAAAQRVRLTDPQKIRLYALFKQATEGDCTKPQPSAFQPVERAKWNGWQSLHGMDATVAKRRYVLLVIELVPSFKMPTDEPRAVARPNDPAPRASELVAPANSGSDATPRLLEQQVQRRVAPAPRLVSRAQQTSAPRLAAATGAVVARRKQPVPALSYAMIALQVVAFVAVAAALLFVSMRVALPLARDVLAQHEDALASSRAVAKSLTPLYWFALGYVFVAAIRSRIFSWRLLTGEFVWLNLASPRTRGGASSGRRAQRRPRRRMAEPAPTPTAILFERLGLELVEEAPSDDGSSASVVPHVRLPLRENADAVRFGDSVTVFPFTLEQTSHVYYCKFKEPLPDPSSPQLVAITVLEEHRFDEYDAVFRRRKLQFKNNAPYIIKRQFASSDYVEYIEDSLLDQRNRTFYVYTKNESFQSFGTIEDYAVYRTTGDTDQWTELSQGARLHITNSSIGFLRSKIESLAASSYAKNIPRTREYHRERLCEEFGEPGGDVLDVNPAQE